jgi:putative peptidoglycan lipid II flippase
MIGVMSKITKASLILFIFFALDKALGILRLSWMTRVLPLGEQDVFHAANNLPDLLFTLISGGALAIAFIPVLSEVLAKQGRPEAWKLFSRVANLAFLVTAALALIFALLADPIIRSGIAPGFDEAQKILAVQLMRLNLVATILFSISGLVMGGLQANQHFLLPAMAPLFYNVGQIVGVAYFAPSEGLGLGTEGVAYGVILGALLHLLIQLPGLLRYQFRWTASLGLATAEVRQVLRLMLPRVFTMFFIQAVFLIRDNLASRLSEGSVTALTSRCRKPSLAQPSPQPCCPPWLNLPRGGIGPASAPPSSVPGGL